MIFETKEDINAPIEQVFPYIADFAGFERSALRRGAEVKRLDTLTGPGPGMKWDLKFQLRGKRREFRLEMAQYDPPNGMRFHTSTTGVDGVMHVDLIAMSRSSTRMSIKLEMQANNLTGRLLLQSLKLAKSSIAGRVNTKLYEFARGTEERLRNA
ncbi:MAG: SRPBCC family protein [Paracoccaceae bacterium]|nr:SRPBCC family protein [Paracoccaceae bacterium]MDG2260368.1 SRPBCC family protein [Paracoccaceae bacterium]